MSRKNSIIAAAWFMTLVWAIAQQAEVSPSAANAPTETKVSESRKNGKYQRITEVFQDKVLQSRKLEVSEHDDGRINRVFTKLFRNGEMIYASSFYKSENRTIRSYYNQGRMVVEEGDEDGDGFFETMILFDANEQPAEAFSKRKDGTVVQFSSEKLTELKKSFAKFQQ